jgi:hypothetical protein
MGERSGSGKEGTLRLGLYRREREREREREGKEGRSGGAE